jgi:hypothetical protein
MPRKNNLIPFRFLPGSWGLVADAYDEAEAFYTLDGEDLERRLLAIRVKDTTKRALEHLELDRKYDRISEYDYAIEKATLENDGTINDAKKLAIDLEFKKIKGFEHDILLAKINFPDEESIEHQIALLTADYDHGKIDLNEYQKTLATAKNEPWVGVIDNSYDADQGVNGLYFELDWNQQWVEFLRKNGYHGHTDVEIVEQWFTDVSRVVEENPDPTDPIPFNSARSFTHGGRRTGGGTEI